MRLPPTLSTGRTWTLAWSLVLACLAACTSWRLAEPTPSQSLNNRPRDIRVIRTDSSRVTLRSAVLRRDTLIGTVGGGLTRGDTTRTLSIPLADVRSIAVRRFSLGKTLGLYFAIALPLGLIYTNAHGGAAY